LSDITGSRKTNMAADKPEINRPVYQLIDVIVPHLERYTDFLWKWLKGTKTTVHVKFLIFEIQTGGRNPPKPDVLITNY